MILVIWGLILVIITLITVLYTFHRSEPITIIIDMNIFKGIKIKIKKDKPRKKNRKNR